MANVLLLLFFITGWGVGFKFTKKIPENCGAPNLTRDKSIYVIVPIRISIFLERSLCSRNAVCLYFFNCMI